MLEVTYGQTRNPMVADGLIDAIQQMHLEGSLYIGYPILATSDESITVDALLVTLKHGLVAFSFDDSSDEGTSHDDVWGSRSDQQDRLFIAVENHLRRHDALRLRRGLGVDVQTVTVIPDMNDIPQDVEGIFSSLGNIPSIMEKFPALDEQYFRPLQAALQRVSTIKPPKGRDKVQSSVSKGAILKKIEREIANLDQWQKSAAIESPDGPQRIRGLAGSGKTIVLALKAAYLHAQNPDWTIAVTFWSRSLYQQFEDLVRRFSFEHSNDEPNWQKLQILHAWGGQGRSGLYQRIAQHCGLPSHNFLYGKAKYGMDKAFSGVCSEMLSDLSRSRPEPVYDAVLVDEAQDLPISFFKLIYEATRDPKRIIWAYDELQNLSESTLPTIEQQFGEDFVLSNPESAPRQDIILPTCYRATPWALSLAHGVGLGTARKNGLVQSFDDPSLWSQIGYSVVSGSLEKGATVTLQRSLGSYPSYFKDLLSPDDAVSSHVFGDEFEQAKWVAKSIKGNIDKDELEYDDILIVLPDTYRAKSQAIPIINELQAVGLDGHLAGTTTSQDELFQPNSIAIAHVYRSKGNEAPMVYVLGAQHCVSARRRASIRNILFTAITRSRSWVRICGWGERMDELREEIDKIRDDGYRLTFKIPTDSELEDIRQIHRDITASEREKIDRAQKGFRNFVDAIERGDISIDDLSIRDRTRMAKYFGKYTDDSR